MHLKYYAEHEKVLEPCRPTYIDELTISILEFHLEVSKEGNLKQTSWQSSTASDMTQITTPIFLPQHQSFITRLASFLFHIKTWSFLWHQSFMSRLGHYSFDIFWMMQSSSMEASQFLPSNWILQRKHYYCHILQALMKLFQFIVYCIVYYIVYYIVMCIKFCCPHNENFPFIFDETCRQIVLNWGNLGAAASEELLTQWGITPTPSSNIFLKSYFIIFGHI